MVTAMSDEWKAKLWQDGIVVAAVFGPNGESVQREIQHYAAQYVQDGPVRIELIPPRRRS
jgi:hypothetical protein